MEGHPAGYFIGWEKGKSQGLDVPWWKGTNELRKGDFREWFQRFLGRMLDCIWRCDLEMFQAIDVLCVVDVELEFEHRECEQQ